VHDSLLGYQSQDRSGGVELFRPVGRYSVCISWDGERTSHILRENATVSTRNLEADAVVAPLPGLLWVTPIALLESSTSDRNWTVC
jgi:hypothetical protein